MASQMMMYMSFQLDLLTRFATTEMSLQTDSVRESYSSDIPHLQKVAAVSTPIHSLKAGLIHFQAEHFS